MYKFSNAHDYLGVPQWVTAGIYELSYGLDLYQLNSFTGDF